MKYLLGILFVLITSFFSSGAKAEGKPDILEVIELNGEVNEFMAKTVQESIEKITDNAKVKAVLVIVNSPGGSGSSSERIYSEIAKIKVPVVGWCDGVCASGGMYILMPKSVKYIGLSPRGVAGSIGVYIVITRFNRLLDWAKVDNERYRSGSVKGAGLPMFAADDAEKKLFQSLTDKFASDFYDLVKAGRGSKIKDWDEIKAAKIFIGEDAVKIGLVDSIMTKEEAVKKAKELSESKSIFTRQELKKMSTAADDPHGSYSIPLVEPKAQLPTSSLGDIPFLIETIKEIKSGESIRIEYKMPYKF